MMLVTYVVGARVVYKNKEDQVLYKKEYYQKNKRRLNEYSQSWKKKNPRKVYLYDVKRQYGLTEEQYEALGSYCLICGDTGNLVVDHCHNKNVVRGKLCQSCNKALGLFKDNITILTNATLYLEKHNGPI